MLIPCAIIWMTAPCSASVFQAKIPSSTKPRWLTLLYATSRFMSVWPIASTAPYRMPTTPSANATGVKRLAASGNSGMVKRIKP